MGEGLGFRLKVLGSSLLWAWVGSLRTLPLWLRLYYFPLNPIRPSQLSISKKPYTQSTLLPQTLQNSKKAIAGSGVRLLLLTALTRFVALGSKRSLKQAWSLQKGLIEIAAICKEVVRGFMVL